MDWMFLPYRRYADFSGRSQRKEFWMFQMFFYLVIGVFVLLTFSLASFARQADGTVQPPGPMFWVFMIAILLFMLGSFIPSIAVTVRRFHDQNLTGWLYLLTFIPYIGALIILVFMCIEGTRGPNKYGDDPKRENTAAVFS